jgi:ribosome-binding factor A
MKQNFVDSKFSVFSIRSTKRKAERGAESIKREIVSVIRHFRKLNGLFISVISVTLSNDASNCRVFVSALEGLEKAVYAAKTLQKMEGFVRSRLARNLRMRFVPNLRFLATDVIEYGANFGKQC